MSDHTSKDAKTGGAIFAGSAGVGLRNVGSYQVSGHPFITGSTNLDNNHVHMVEFDYVAKAFTVINNNSNSGEDIRVHFLSGSGVNALTSSGYWGHQAIADTADVIAKHHYITVPAGNGSVTFDVKCKRFYVSNGSGTDNLKYQVFAELTGIPKQRMFNLTGSGITE
jgi:hypothetical protein